MPRTSELYLSLYNELKDKIISGDYAEHQKLPSKRDLSRMKGVSLKTIENALDMLLTEGYIYAEERRGDFVSPLNGYRSATADSSKKKSIFAPAYQQTKYRVNLRENKNAPEDFPDSVWCRLMRETLLDHRDELFDTIPFNGLFELRVAIANHLHEFHDMDVDPNRIIIGAGTEYLYGRLIQLLGEGNTYAIEDPGSPRIREIYQSNHAPWRNIPCDENGIQMEALSKSSANIVHVSPAHHYPLGFVTPIARRVELLKWVNAKPGRYIIEDDYDSEYCVRQKPVPSIYSIDINDKVIYMNTFSKSVSPAVRISYMILPISLMSHYFETMSFYSCTVPSFEQFTLAKFISGGHLHRYVRKVNQKNETNKERLMVALSQFILKGHMSVFQETSGPHLLITINSEFSDAEVKQFLRAKSVMAAFLQEYCVEKRPEYEHVLVVNYSGINDEKIKYLCDVLRNLFGD